MQECGQVIKQESEQSVCKNDENMWSKKAIKQNQENKQVGKQREQISILQGYFELSKQQN